MPNQQVLNNQITLTRSLADVLEKDGAHVQFFETHISWVLVTESLAYKFKKAVHFDFLDFSTLEARDFYCREEVRLNRRLAPDLYLDVVSITGSPEHPRIDADGTPIEYAVRMRAFPQQALWSHRIATGAIAAAEADALAGKVARFHAEAAIAAQNSGWGTPEALRATADENLKTIASLASGSKEKAQLREIQAWQAVHWQALRGAFEHRRAHGMIRECHGDLHSGNILTTNGQVEVFDCIEFNEALRWIDVINDVAFIYMDLQFQHRQDLAARLLNHYLEVTGDYDGLSVLRYYALQRALVRCKAGLLRARQLGTDRQQDAAAHEKQALDYLAWAARFIRPAPTAVVIAHGFSGSGKSFFSERLAELVGAIRLRSDVERKRMHGLAPLSRAAALPGAELYDAAATQMTYTRLHDLARHGIESGLPVIVDAAFLKQDQRRLFTDLAKNLRVPFFIVDVRASEATMKERIIARAQRDDDPSDAGLQVLAHQLAHHDPLSDDEMKHAVAVDGERSMDSEAIRRSANPVLEWLNNTVD